MQKKVVQIEKENIGSENIISMGSEDGKRLEAELIRVKTMDDGLGKDLVAFGLKLGICSDSMEFECMDLVAEEGCAGMDSQYRGKRRNKAQKENGKILLHGNDGAKLKRVKKIDDGRGWIAFGLIFGVADSMEYLSTDLDTKEGCET